MAEIVLGLATSHSPQLRIAPEQWHLLVEKDEKDPRFDYQQLLRNANPTLGQELTQMAGRVSHHCRRRSKGSLSGLRIHGLGPGSKLWQIVLD